MDPRLYHRPRIEWWQLGRRWRRWREEVQHHSAPIRRTHWQSVVVSLWWRSMLVAPLFSIATSLLVERESTTVVVKTWLHCLPDGRWVDDGGRDVGGAPVPPVDVFSIPDEKTFRVEASEVVTSSGWPAASESVSQALWKFGPVDQDTPPTPMPQNLTAWLGAQGLNFTPPGPWVTRQSLLGWIVNTAVGWPIVFAVCWVGALLGRSVQLFIWRRRARIETGRADQGLCPGCGHVVDRAGFSERCPECGFFLHRR
jgi:hypothetical protein